MNLKGSFAGATVVALLWTVFGTLGVGAADPIVVELEVTTPAEGSTPVVRDLYTLQGKLTAMSSNLAPTANLAATLDELTATFTMSASDSDGTIASWSLDTDSDNAAEYSGSGAPPASQVHTYPAPGTYSARLRVIDNGGASGDAVRLLSVGVSSPPDATITAAPTDLTVTYTLTATDPDGGIQAWSVDYETDGTDDESGTGDPPTTLTHTFDEAGTYTTTFEVSDNDDLTDTATVEVTVTEPVVVDPEGIFWFHPTPEQDTAATAWAIAGTMDETPPEDDTGKIALAPAGYHGYVSDGSGLPWQILGIGFGTGVYGGAAPAFATDEPLALTGEPVTVKFWVSSAMPAYAVFAPFPIFVEVTVYDVIDVTTAVQLAKGVAFYDLALPVADPGPTELSITFDGLSTSGDGHIVVVISPQDAIFDMGVMAVHYDSTETPSCMIIGGGDCTDGAGVEVPPVDPGEDPAPVAVADPPSNAPGNPLIDDPAGDVGNPGLFDFTNAPAPLNLLGQVPPPGLVEGPIGNLDMREVWFDNDDEYLYAGMRIEVPLPTSAMDGLAYTVQFTTGWFNPDPDPSDGDPFDGFTTWELVAYADVNNAAVTFQLLAYTANGFLIIATLPDSVYDSTSGIFWWAVPLDVFDGAIPPMGSAVTGITARTGKGLSLVAPDPLGFFGGSLPLGFTYTGYDVGAPESASAYILTADVPPQPLSAQAGGPYSGTEDEALLIVGGYTGGEPPYTCAWSGSGSPVFQDPAACSTQVTYADPGVFALTLTVTDNLGAQATSLASVSIAPDGGGEEPPPPPPPTGGGTPPSGTVAIRKDNCNGDLIASQTINGNSNPMNFAITFDTYLLPNGVNTVFVCYSGEGFVPAQLSRQLDVQNQERTSAPPPPPAAPPGLVFDLRQDASTVAPGERAGFQLIVTNPADEAQSFTAQYNVGDGWMVTPKSMSDTVPGKSQRVYAGLVQSPGAGGATTLVAVISAQGNAYQKSLDFATSAKDSAFDLRVRQVTRATGGSIIVSMMAQNYEDSKVTVKGDIRAGTQKVPFSHVLEPQSVETITVEVPPPSRQVATLTVSARSGEAQPVSITVPVPQGGGQAIEPPQDEVKAKDVIIEASLVRSTAEGNLIGGRILLGSLPAAGVPVTVVAAGQELVIVTDSVGRFEVTVPSSADRVTIASEGVQRTVILSGGSLSTSDNANVPAMGLFAALAAVGLLGLVLRRRRVF